MCHYASQILVSNQSTAYVVQLYICMASTPTGNNINYKIYPWGGKKKEGTTHCKQCCCVSPVHFARDLPNIILTKTESSVETLLLLHCLYACCPVVLQYFCFLCTYKWLCVMVDYYLCFRKGWKKAQRSDLVTAIQETGESAGCLGAQNLLSPSMWPQSYPWPKPSRGGICSP